MLIKESESVLLNDMTKDVTHLFWFQIQYFSE